MEIFENKIARQMMLPYLEAIQDSKAKEHHISAKVLKLHGGCKKMVQWKGLA